MVRICLQCSRHRRHKFDLWVRNIPWTRKQQPTAEFLPEISHGWRSLASGCLRFIIVNIQSKAPGKDALVLRSIMAQKAHLHWPQPCTSQAGPVGSPPLIAPSPWKVQGTLSSDVQPPGWENSLLASVSPGPPCSVMGACTEADTQALL